MRKKGNGASLVVTAVLVLAVLGGGGGLAATFLLGAKPPSLAAIDDQTVIEQQPFSITVRPAQASDDALIYSLASAPDGATIDAQSGIVSWIPSETQGPGRHEFVVRAAREAHPEAQATIEFAALVQEANRPPNLPPIEDQFVAVGGEIVFALKGYDADRPAQGLIYRLGEGGPEGAAIDQATGRFSWKPTASDAGASRKINVELLETEGERLTASQKFTIHVRAAGAPADTLASIEVKPAAPTAPDVPTPAPTPIPAPPPAPSGPVAGGDAPNPIQDSDKLFGFTQAEADAIYRLQDQKQLFKPTAYPELRRVFAERFEREHAKEIEAAWGDAASPLRSYLAKNRDLAEELFLAIDPAHDKLDAALKLFARLHEKYPKQLAQYGNLAIAVAITWDDPSAIYDYEQHRERAKATKAEAPLDGLGNFEYFLKAEGVMEGRARFLPWEFLVHVVNHRTPLAERQWAVGAYLNQRAMIGKCYSDVPYDFLMLNSNDVSAKLNGQAYNLPNIKTFGGVCSYQADFASRVSQSLGVPAAYVSGQANSGDHHAWVMWVELKAVTPTSIGYTLESHGRYNIDHYYVGELVDPHTGQPTTDRQLELSLHTIGLNYLARRQAELLMRSLPLLRERSMWDLQAELRFLSAVIESCPGCESAWLATAKRIEDTDDTPATKKMLSAILERMFVVFAAFPDFTWKIFDEMIAFEKAAPKRIDLYRRLVETYENQKRPDLACEARLVLSDLLHAEKKDLAAIEGLAYTIKKFPDEGRHVPRMLDKLEDLCKGISAGNGAGKINGGSGAARHLVAFYTEFLPLIPPKRGDAPSQYCMAMYQRGIDRFQEYGQEQLAQQLLVQLNAIRAGK